jgi:hypothetical protein
MMYSIFDIMDTIQVSKYNIIDCISAILDTVSYMTYQERKSITFLITTTLSFCIYACAIYWANATTLSMTPNDFSFWGKVYLGMVAAVALPNLAAAYTLRWFSRAIINDAVPQVIDERDRWIEFRAIWLSHCVFVAGFLLAMATQAMHLQPWVMFVTLGLAAFAAAMTTEVTKLLLYRTGP